MTAPRLCACASREASAEPLGPNSPTPSPQAIRPTMTIGRRRAERHAADSGSEKHDPGDREPGFAEARRQYPHQSALHADRDDGEREQRQADGARSDVIAVHGPDREDRFQGRLRERHQQRAERQPAQRRQRAQQLPRVCCARRAKCATARCWRAVALRQHEQHQQHRQHAQCTPTPAPAAGSSPPAAARLPARRRSPARA